MFYLFVIYIIICLIGVSFKDIKSSNKDVLSINTTTMINGVFVIMIIFSHFNSYVNYSNKLDLIYFDFFKKFGQLMVVTFFFYSGYGIYESIKIKGKSYIDNFLKHRFLKVYLPFAMAIVLFMICNFFMNKNYALFDNLLAFTGYTSIGNSNWFMLITFIMYIITYITFKYIKKDDFTRILIVVVLSLICMMIMYLTSHPSFWYNTLICYSMGMIFSYSKSNIFEYLKNNFHYLVCLVFNILIFCLAYLNGGF